MDSQQWWELGGWPPNQVGDGMLAPIEVRDGRLRALLPHPIMLLLQEVKSYTSTRPKTTPAYMLEFLWLAD